MNYSQLGRVQNMVEVPTAGQLVPKRQQLKQISISHPHRMDTLGDLYHITALLQSYSTSHVIGQVFDLLQSASLALCLVF
jgi:hypothetical protein